MSADESEFHYCRKWVIVWGFVFVSVHVRDRANENDRRNPLSFSFLSARKYPSNHYVFSRLHLPLDILSLGYCQVSVLNPLRYDYSYDY